jgi:hypothetical protein
MKGRPIGRSALVLVAVVAVLGGALLFGLWHVVVGWLIHGNPRAGSFGVFLSLAAGGLLAATVLARRRLRA